MLEADWRRPLGGFFGSFRILSHTREPRRGGRSRAATPFACGAGTLGRGFADGSRMISRLTRRMIR